MNSNLLETKLSSEVIYDGRIVQMQRWQVELPNGKVTDREIVHHNGGAGVLALTDDGMALMVRQYRAPLERVMLEIPAGKLEGEGADPLLAAQRELSEETGYTAANWRHLTSIQPTVGYSDETIHIYLATGLTSGKDHPDEDEFLSVELLPFDALYEQVLRGEITDGKTVVALLMAKASLS